ncbi:MAG: DUF4230 domain-containing protein [Candidatus Fibromonas sp.]|jgi:hypothetical protein|nr:DUF4230 domain-containing protein [Candidatus Fibromonas sp.]
MFRIVVILAILLAVATAAIGFLIGRPSGGSSYVTPRQETSIHTTVRAVLPAAEFVSLHYRYTSVIKDASSKEMFGIPIPGTEKKMLAMIDGTIKLGINCKDIKIDTSRSDTLFLKLPPIKIISHELHPETAEVYDQKDGIFNKYRASDQFALEAKQKAEVELDVRANRELILQARAATEYAFKSFLQGLPVLNTIPVAFTWN